MDTKTNALEKAKSLLKAWKPDYIFGLDVLPRLGEAAKKLGKKALVISGTSPHWSGLNSKILSYLKDSGITVASGGVIAGAKPNAPREDVYRLESCILHYKPDFIVAAGGGSSIDCVKAANALAALGAVSDTDIGHYFGVGVISAEYQKYGVRGLPVLALQTSASSGAHLTKYSNITDPAAGQKMLIVDEAIVPAVPFFDYALSATMPLSLTLDGAFDGIAHCFEVFCGAKEGAAFDKAAEITEAAIELVLANVPALVKNGADMAAREAAGLATDLGGYAIMTGGTSGPHLTSFSLVDVAAHGTACGIMNPYYMVFYSKAIQRQLKITGEVFARHGFMPANPAALSGRELAVAVADAMRNFAKSIGAPSTLGELKGFGKQHITRALNAAKSPQLEMKLKNMPVPLTAGGVEEYMLPVLRAAASGDMTLIKEMP
ncbi:MAG: iron-containing alcohol dehydrogenase [Spirochaetaceae bacterium]|jgi:alcohol dehydrogenase|nr:iron-containing alcohol dehydrogenase [Spirochaetaceae bacterium]